MKTKAEAEAHAASSVAIRWLESSAAIIANGGNPAPLSKQAVDLAGAELERPMYDAWQWRAATLRRIAEKAISEAKLRLICTNDFDSVRRHFSKG